MIGFSGHRQYKRFRMLVFLYQGNNTLGFQLYDWFLRSQLPLLGIREVSFGVPAWPLRVIIDLVLLISYIMIEMMVVELVMMSDEGDHRPCVPDKFVKVFRLVVLLET